MKNIILSITLLISFATATYAVCSIQTGYCDPSTPISTPSLEEKYAPNNLRNMQKPDAFENNPIQKFDPLTINTEPDDRIEEATPTYNSNCQFGVCLPGEVSPNPLAR